MSYVLIFAASVLPAVLLFLYIWHKDPIPEPCSWLARCVLMGMLICIPVVSVESAIQQWLFGGSTPTTITGVMLMAFLVAAVPEEYFKLYVLHNQMKKNPYFDEHIDGIVYAVCVGLGFATVENVFYVFGNLDNWASVAFTRALLAVPAHYAFAVLMGYFYGLYFFVDRNPATKFKILLVPVAVHGLYDTLAMMNYVSPLIGSLAFLALIGFCMGMHRICRKRIELQLDRDMQEAYRRWARLQGPTFRSDPK